MYWGEPVIRWYNKKRMEMNKQDQRPVIELLNHAVEQALPIPGAKSDMFNAVHISS